MLGARTSLSRGQTLLAASCRASSTTTASTTTTTSSGLVDSDGDAGVPISQWENARPFHEIPGPKPLPLLGNTWRFFPKIGTYKDLDALNLQIRLRKDFGDIVRVSKVFGRKETVFLFNPVSVEKILRHEGPWPIRDGVKTIHYYRTVMNKDKYKSLSGTITSQGEAWQSFRSKVSQPLMKPSSANRYSESINDVAQEFVEIMRELRDSNLELPSGFINELYKWSLESIAVVALDTRLGCLQPDLPKNSEPQKMIDAVQEMLDGIYHLDLQPSIWRYVSTPRWRRMVRAMDYFSETADKYIQQAMVRESSNPKREKSILQRLLQEGSEVANLMVTDMLFGGVDTTSHSTANFMFRLAKNPEKQKKLSEEIRRFLPRAADPITAEILSEMKYLKACLRESLRLLPITLFNLRGTPKDIVIENYQIPKGTDVFLCHMVMSHDPRHYPDPMAFIPERWLRGGALAHSAHPFVTLPFGFGPRTCVGRRFAELEIQTLVAKIVRNFWVEYDHSDELKFVAKSINYITSPLNFRLIDKS